MRRRKVKENADKIANTTSKKAVAYKLHPKLIWMPIIDRFADDFIELIVST